MGYTNFPNGITVSGVPTMGIAGVPASTGAYWFVSSGTNGGIVGNNGYPGTANQPFATLAQALSVAAYGDTIILEAGHAETVSAAAGINVNVAGVTIIGEGEGATRPTFTFGTSTAATITITAASVSMTGIVGVCNIDQIVSPFVISAANVTLGLEWQDGAANKEAIRAVLTTAAADNLTLNLTYKGFTAGTHCVNGVRLVGCNNGSIAVNLYGKASTAWVEFVTTLSSNIVVTGYMYNSGTTDGSKDVVDTVTGSLWYALIQDGSAGFTYEGGSGSAFAPSDSAAVSAALLVPAANATTNVNERDVIGNKTDTAVYVPGTTKSNAAYAKGTSDLQEKVALKAAATITNGQTLFTVAGGPIMVMGLVSICVTGNDGTASTLQYSATPTSGSAQTISAASASLASALAGASVTLAGTALATAALLNANGPNLIANPGTVMVPAGIITAVVGVGSTTGTWAHYIRYRPLATGVTVS